jgi:hypothetical protein
MFQDREKVATKSGRHQMAAILHCQRQKRSAIWSFGTFYIIWLSPKNNTWWLAPRYDPQMTSNVPSHRSPQPHHRSAAPGAANEDDGEFRLTDRPKRTRGQRMIPNDITRYGTVPYGVASSLVDVLDVETMANATCGSMPKWYHTALFLRCGDFTWYHSDRAGGSHAHFG